MACTLEYVAVAGTYAAMISAAVAAGLTVETVVATPVTVGAFIAAALGYISACGALGACLADSGDADAAQKMKDKADSMQRDIDALKRKLGMD